MTCTNRKTTQAEVLLRVQARLISAISSLNVSTCFLTLEPEPPMEVKGNLFLTVCPMSGQFDEGFMVGAGQAGALESAGVIVTIWSACKLDKAGEAGTALTDATRGILAVKRKVLAALTSHDLLNSSGQPMLTAYMKPVSSDVPRASVYNTDQKLGLPLAFSTEFIWDLSD